MGALHHVHVDLGAANLKRIQGILIHYLSDNWVEIERGYLFQAIILGHNGIVLSRLDQDHVAVELLGSLIALRKQKLLFEHAGSFLDLRIIKK